MIPKQKRPIGVTFLAVVFLWVGCGSAVFLPVFGPQDLGLYTVSRIIHSAVGIKIAMNSLWFVIYAVQGVIGFGLWKLKNWGRWGIIAIFAAGTIDCLLRVPRFAKPGAEVFTEVIASVLSSFWVVWYLNRPRVRFAFGVFPTGCDGAPSSEPPPGLSKMGKVWVWVGIAASIALVMR